MNFADHIQLRQVDRRLPVPLWAIAIVALWLGMIALCAVLAPAGGDEFTLCHFKRMTGVPCATCGTTRAAIAVSRGDFVEALWLNPLTTTLGAGLAMWLILRLGLGLRLQIQFTRRQRSVFWILAAALLGANWIFLILSGR